MNSTKKKIMFLFLFLLLVILGWFACSKVDPLHSDREDDRFVINYSEKIIAYTVSFDTNGGSIIAPVGLAEKEKLLIPQLPLKENFYFAGWYANEGLSQKYDFTLEVTEDLTLYAKWLSASDYTIEENVAADSVAISVYTGSDQHLEIPTEINGKPVTSIVDNAFANNTNLQSISLPETLEQIGDSAFAGCSALQMIDVPDSVTSLGAKAFADCTSLTDVTLSNQITVILNETFGHCTSLKSITLPDSITELGDNAFTGCSLLQTVILSQNLLTFGTGVFRDCIALPNITLPAKVQDLGNHTFSGCSSLMLIASLNLLPPTVGVDAFFVVPATCSIKVPAEALSAYQLKDGWSVRSAQIKAL